MSFKILSCAFPCCMGQVRYMIVFLLFAGSILVNCHRQVLNIAIVEMVSLTSEGKQSTCPAPHQKSSVIKNIGGGKLNWSPTEQYLVLSAFFPTYVIMHIPFGMMLDKLGARNILLWCFVISAIATALIPLSAVYGAWWVVCILRLITGGAQASWYPAVATLISRWIPPNERATVGATVFASNAFGMLTGNVITGFMIRFLEDWRIAYYMWGGVSMVCALLFFGYVFSDPGMSPFITSVELVYLKELIVQKEPMPHNLVAIITDVCVWGLCAGQFGHGFVLFTFQSILPKYLNNVLGFDISDNALTANLFILQWFSGFIFGMLSDYLINKKNANVNLMRKVYSLLANIFAAIGLLLMGLAQCDYLLALVALGFSIFMKGLFFPGLKVNIVDISINHTALVMAVTNGVGAIPGIICTNVVSLIVPNNAHSEWFYAFLGIVGIELIVTVMYAFMSTTERRKWDYKDGEAPPPKKKANRWYLETTPSEFALQRNTVAQAVAQRKLAEADAKEKMKQEIRATQLSRRT